MIETLLLMIGGWTVCWLVYIFAGAVSYARDVSYRPPPELKWAVNPRVMRWLIPIIGVGVCAYVGYLKYLGLI